MSNTNYSNEKMTNVEPFQPFPNKLYNMLQADAKDGSNTVTWLPQEDGFLILDEQAFINSVVPVYFNLTKMRSFTRQLNLWGFIRWVNALNVIDVV